MPDHPIPLAPEAESKIAASALLGYLNYSTGKPDPKFQSAWNEAQAVFAPHGGKAWNRLTDYLLIKLEHLQKEGSPVFTEIRQAREVLQFLPKVLNAYRIFHADLFLHLTEAELFQPYFIVRVLEAILKVRGTREDEDKAAKSCLKQLNTFLGYRPVAILENKSKGEPYSHEKFCPIPIYLRQAGPAHGKYEKVVKVALEILYATPTGLLEDAGLDLQLLDEWSIDPRAYDHNHPANRRPNYVFGEWDARTLDEEGRFRRLVTRQVTIDALLERIPAESEKNYHERLYEGGAVLAGIVLMSTSITGRAPGAIDSTYNLSTLVPRIAKLRDEFYNHLLDRNKGGMGERLKEESKVLRQPFGGARQHLNQTLARGRAEQLQQRRLALLYAIMGFPDEARNWSDKLAVPSIRFTTEAQSLIASSHHCLERGDLDTPKQALIDLEDLIRRGIQCGAFADPWNALGFQGLFPLFQSMEDSIHDHRIDELCMIMEGTFSLYSRLLCESAARGEIDQMDELHSLIRKLSNWWDKFATAEVTEVPEVRGREIVDSGEKVAATLHDWHEQGVAASDIAFWRKHSENLDTPSSSAVVVDILLRRKDYTAAMALLIHWLGQAEVILLEDGDHSFHALAIQWMHSVVQDESLKPAERWKLVRRFLDLIEANAEEYWNLESLRIVSGEDAPLVVEDGEDDDTFAAAYEDMAYRDSTDDGTDGALAEAGPGFDADFPLEEEGDELIDRLHFHATVAQLWREIATEVHTSFPKEPDVQDAMNSWLSSARNRRARILSLLKTLTAFEIPVPSGAFDAMVDYDRKRSMKERVLEATIVAALDLTLAEMTLAGQGMVGDSKPILKKQDWRTIASLLEFSMNSGDTPATRKLLPLFEDAFRDEQLLYSPLDAGGDPEQIYSIRMAQTTLREILENLPRLGLFRETYQLLKLAREMERNKQVAGRVITEFNRLFQHAVQSVATCVVYSSAKWNPLPDAARIIEILERIARPFMALWMDHSQTVRLSTMEIYLDDEPWKELKKFITDYGRDLFSPRFMTLGNLRSILSRGVDNYLEYLEQEKQNSSDDVPGIKLIESLQHDQNRGKTIHLLEAVIKAVVENFEEYKDYNATTTQSDYGDNVHRLLSFLRLKAQYDRHSWSVKPLVWIHEALARAGHDAAALQWQQAFTKLTSEWAKKHLANLKKIQAEHGMLLRTVADLVEEKFTIPLDVDRLVALIQPAMKEAEAGTHEGQAFKRFRQAVQPLAQKATGVGLDLPSWLKSLEGETERIKTGQSQGRAFDPPVLTLSEDKIQETMKGLDTPGSGFLIP